MRLIMTLNLSPLAIL